MAIRKTGPETPVVKRRRAESRGRFAESLAVLLLRLKGWSILERRFFCGQGRGTGEIDIIARRGRVLAFIEVKARVSVAEALESLRLRQRARIERGAQAWLKKHRDCEDMAVRFDMIAVPRWGIPRHVKGAWRPGDGLPVNRF